MEKSLSINIRKCLPLYQYYLNKVINIPKISNFAISNYLNKINRKKFDFNETLSYCWNTHKLHPLDYLKDLKNANIPLSNNFPEIKNNEFNYNINLLEAYERQYEFAKKIINKNIIISDYDKLISQYIKFLKSSKNIKEKEYIVPTLPIDLVWHTHMLYPKSYHDDCLRILGYVLDHDGNIPKEVLDKYRDKGVNSTNYGGCGFIMTSFNHNHNHNHSNS